jgi:hypothetical protein
MIVVISHIRPEAALNEPQRFLEGISGKSRLL